MTKELTYVPFFEGIQDPFSSYDIGMCAGLVSQGFSLAHIEKNKKSKALFVFENTPELVEAAQDYWRGALRVDALTYFNALKNIKNRLYSEF